MTNLISYEELRKIQTQERENKSIQEINKNFFENVREYIRTKKELIDKNEGKDNAFSKQTYEKASQELTNIYKILEDICARRHRKIIFQALTNISARVHNTENMLQAEEEIYNDVINVLKVERTKFMDNFKVKDKEPVEMQEGKGDLKMLRITDDVPSFVWTDNNTYGPFAKEDVTNLPNLIAEILIKQGKAIEIRLEDEKNENAQKSEEILPKVQ